MTENRIHTLKTQLFFFSASIQIKKYFTYIGFSNIPFVIQCHSAFNNVIVLGKNSVKI